MFLVQKFAKFWPFRGLWVRGFNFCRLLLQKAHVFVNPRHLSHFAWRLVKGSDPQACSWKKVRKSHTNRKDMSPLTQGLNYRLACNTHRLMESDFWYDVILARCRPWHHFTIKSLRLRHFKSDWAKTWQDCSSDSQIHMHRLTDPARFSIWCHSFKINWPGCGRCCMQPAARVWRHWLVHSSWSIVRSIGVGNGGGGNRGVARNLFWGV